MPEPTIQYADYAYWQRQRLRGEALAQQLPYWRDLLNDLPMLQLPTDRPRPTVRTFRGVLESFVLPRTLVDALKEVSRREGVSLYMTLIAAFAAQLHRYTAQDDIVIGTPSSNRDRPEIEKTMGFFLNTLALRANVEGDPTFRELVTRVRTATLDGHAHQDVPFEMVVRDLQPQRNFAHNPLFQVMFTLEPPHAPLDVPWSASTIEINVGTPKLDLSVELDDTGDGISGRIQCDADLFDAATVVRMIGHYRTMLEGIATDPTRRVSELPLMTDAERHQMLVEWNATAADYPRERCFHELFAAQAAKTPDAIAAIFASEQITYRALNQRANQLAHHLQAHGVGSDVFVGVCVERSLEMLVAVLAVLKAGGAYVPLDPAYPRERLAF
ncbi:MAG: non-ribosomal peptide synthetase, partial [Rhodanobacteraceae bacterium]